MFKLISLCDTDEDAQRIRPLLAAQLAADADGDAHIFGQLTQALPGYIEIVPSSASKATACSALLERWGLSWADAVAIGDGSNDVPMLEAAAAGGGTSIAMANGGAAVKAAAQHVTVGTNAEDGWVEAMEQHVLARL